MEAEHAKPGTLVLTTDLPYFPGRNGHDFFNLRHLAGHHAVGVVGPLHDFFPAEGLKNLEDFLTGSYFWPRAAPEPSLPPLRALPTGQLRGWVRRRTAVRLRHWLRRLLGLRGQPTDAYVQLATLCNCAPQLLAALAAHGWPHKNHARLVAAFGLIAKDLPPDVRLVFTGRPFAPDHPACAAIAEHHLEKRVVHLGYRSPLEMRALYANALAMVFPSLFEGFGMPVAEAMIAGCAVACSNTTSLPEIAGDAAVAFDPTSPSEIAAAMLRLALDADLRAACVAAGQRRSALFSARSSALKTLGIYRRVFEDFHSPGGEHSSPDLQP